jgi:hypothetical protein
MIRAKGSSFDGASDGTSDLFADVAELTMENMSADGTVDIVNGTIYISKGSAAAITLAAPTDGTDDGKVLKFVSTTAYAHVITSPVDGFNAAGSSGTATFGAAKGNSIVLMALKGHWYVRSAIGISEFASGSTSAGAIQTINLSLLTGTEPVTITIDTITSYATALSKTNAAFATLQGQLDAIWKALT